MSDEFSYFSKNRERYSGWRFGRECLSRLTVHFLATFIFVCLFTFILMDCNFENLQKCNTKSLWLLLRHNLLSSRTFLFDPRATYEFMEWNVEVVHVTGISQSFEYEVRVWLEKKWEFPAHQRSWSFVIFVATVSATTSLGCNCPSPTGSWEKCWRLGGGRRLIDGCISPAESG